MSPDQAVATPVPEASTVDQELPMSPRMTIDGAGVAGTRTFPVHDPATGEVVAQAPNCTDEEMERAIEAARRAFETSWSRDSDLRASALRACAEVLRANVDELAPLLTREQGKPIAEARREIGVAADRFEYFAGLSLSEQIIEDDDRALVRVVRKPLGVNVMLTPWNSPLSVAGNKIAPALSAGNTAVLKPSPDTPLTTLRLGELLAPVLPPGTLNVVSGLEPLGANLCGHPVPRRISVTGSIGTGQAVLRTAAADLKRVTAELGGNDAAIVLPDADPETIVDGIFRAAFANSGQICVAIKRLYVHSSIKDRLVELLLERIAQVRLGPGLDESTTMGPLATAAQRDWVETLVAEAAAQGATVLTGGRRVDGPGNFYEPTLVVDVDASMRLVAEEQFGPALPVLAFDDVEHVLSEVNGGIHGLGGSVWSSDPEQALAVAERLEAGTVWINGHRILAAHQPMGAVKSSGVGVHGGELGLWDCTETRLIWQGRAASSAAFPPGLVAAPSVTS
ncbi:aldehyde dehydrogenase family protein [Nocardioides zeae]|uniref:Acyl-CoA reductase-like NAD-dependent aldehyde dehydrogenase n=1 Tax=Nocardioides zeae TaxID=1457234 RepID=A0AAJ1U4F4_9ACTN|nr:aldehyde dehydrogenase family protein [Nocardioides zeae]MDQ1105690.1 acyl-CoA reductase-like NAD-dependent aldehyde dehydrogenase [Nocardioides zeae]